MRYMLERGYRGAIYPINPKHAQIAGYKAYPDVLSVPRPCDVALVAVASQHVAKVLDDCGAAGIPFAVVLSAGFSEIGEAGMGLQRELDAAIARNPVRVVGPNCVGVANLGSGAILAFGGALNDPNLKPGPVAIVSQSGGVGLSIMAYMQSMGLGLNYLVSAGNETDLQILDFVDHMLERDDVSVVVAYLESTTDGRRLREVGRRALEAGKPIVVMKTGNSGAARRAAASHTGRLTADYQLFRMAFREGGYIEVDDLDDLVNVTKLALAGRFPAGRNVAVLTVSGGWGVMMAEHAERNGLALPAPAPATTARLRELTPSFASLGNPIDMTPAAYKDQYRSYNHIIEALLADPGIDQLLVRSGHGRDIGIWADQFLGIFAASKKPIVVNWAPAPHMYTETRDLLEKQGAVCIGLASRCARAAGALTDFSLARQAAKQRDAALATRPIPRAALDLPARGTLDEHAAKRALSRYGVPVTSETVLTAEAVEALAQCPVPFPVAVKIVSPDIPHKTEAGGVRLGLASLADVKEAARTVVANAKRHAPDARIEGVLLQEMAAGTELIVGAVADPQFGPYVLLGLGGIYAEALEDVTRRFAPLTRAEAQEMIGTIKAGRLLAGLRGLPPGDVAALVDTLVRLSWMIADHADRIAEIDVNPLFVRPRGRGVVAADALVVLQDR